MQDRDRQRGEGRLSSLFWLAMIGALGYAGYNAAPAYMAHYVLKDKMLEVCRLPKGTNPDAKILDILMKEVREQSLDPYVNRDSFRISTRENGRRINLDYDREVVFLPGIRRMIHFTGEVDQPTIW